MSTLVHDNPTQARFGPARATWRTLLTHVQKDTPAQARLEAASDLAARLDALLIGVAAEMPQPVAIAEPTGLLAGDFEAIVREAVQRDLADAATVFRAGCGEARTQWVALEDMPSEAICRLARGADLIVTGGGEPARRNHYRWCDSAELAIKAGRPALVVPPGGGRLEAKAAVVAWKDSRESRRALADALPILKCADEVVILSVCGKNDVADATVHAQAVVDFLQRHGVGARPKVVAGDATDVVPELHREADATAADLIVAGAYGHSRFGEWVFGGVTRDLLLATRRFLLLSH